MAEAREGVLGPPPGHSGQDGSGLGDRLHLVQLSVAVQGHVAAGRQRGGGALAQGAGQRLHGQVVAHEEPVEADRASDDLIDHQARGCGRVVGIIGGVDHVRRHPQGHIRQRPEGRKIDRLQFVPRGLHNGQGLVAVGSGPAVAGDMLDHGQHATREKPLGGGTPERGDGSRIVRIGAVADDVVGAGNGHVEDRQAIHVDPDRPEIMGDQTRAKIRHVPLRAPGIRSVVGAAGRVAAPMRRAHALHAPALLIDEDRHVLAARNLTE
jgi:hypothetical protein